MICKCRDKGDAAIKKGLSIKEIMHIYGYIVC